MDQTLYFLDYLVSHPNAILGFKASDMVLNVHSDASYLTGPNSCSHAGDLFLLAGDSTETKDKHRACLGEIQDRTLVYSFSKAISPPIAGRKWRIHKLCAKYAHRRQR